MIYDILTFPDERLRQTTQPIEAITPEISTLIEDMFKTMYKNQGIGLAATQINIPLKICVIEIPELKTSKLTLINPVITERLGTTPSEDGCLSVPDIRAEIKRAQEITVEAIDAKGKPFALHATGLLAMCIQHELDHLDGKLFIDHLSRLKLQRLLDRLEKQREGNLR